VTQPLQSSEIDTARGDSHGDVHRADEGLYGFLCLGDFMQGSGGGVHANPYRFERAGKARDRLRDLPTPRYCVPPTVPSLDGRACFRDPTRPARPTRQRLNAWTSSCRSADRSILALTQDSRGQQHPPDGLRAGRNAVAMAVILDFRQQAEWQCNDDAGFSR
jgi:hypothetical protein